MKIQHNISAINSNRQLSIVTGALADNAQKLSSGYRINKAADDAAGLSISEKMRKQIRGLSQAGNNAEDGISMVQTAEGALEEVHEMLQRMNELAVQAANGTNSENDRQNIQDEIVQIKSEIDRVSATTKFNEISLLDGHLAAPGNDAQTRARFEKYMQEKDATRNSSISPYFKAIAGEKKGTTYSLDELNEIDGLKLIYTEITNEVNTTQTAIGTATGYNTTDGNQFKQILKEQIVPQAVTGLLNSFGNTFGYLQGSSIGIGLAIEDDISSSTLASVTMGISYYPETPIRVAEISYKLTVNVGRLKDSNGLLNLSESARNNLEVTIIHEMMHGLMDEVLTNGMMGYDGTSNGLNNSLKFPAWFAEGMAQVAAGGCYNGNDWVNSTLGIDASTTEAAISSTVKDSRYQLGTGTNSSLYGTGYLASMYLGYLAAGKPSTLTAANMASGADTILNEIKSGKSLEDVVKQYTNYSSIAAFEAGFGDADSAAFIKKLVGTVGADGTGGVVAGFTSQGSILPNQAIVPYTLFELNTSNTTVGNQYPAGYDVMTGGSKGTGGTAGPSTGAGGTGGTGGTQNQGQTTGYGIMSLHIGADADMTNKLMVRIAGMGTKQICVDEADVTTEQSATRAIDIIAFAMQEVSAQRSLLGAYQNRLEHTAKNLDNVVENTTAAESMIRDTDMAEEMVHYTNNNVLQQAGQAMLAQANQINQGALTLIA